MELKTLPVGPEGLTVHYYRAGRGAPLLYLHHMLGLRDFEPALEMLAEHYDVIAPFAPGWGPAKNDLEAIDPGPLDITLHNADVLDALGVEAAHVVGVSIGAWMAAELAAILPGRVRSLVLVNPVGMWDDDLRGEDAFAQHPGFPSRVLFSEGSLREKLIIGGRDKVEAHVEELLNLRASAKFLWPIPETGVARRLPRVKARTLIATSEKDVVVPEGYGAAWQSAISGAQLSHLSGVGHLAELENPESFAALVRGFIN